MADSFNKAVMNALERVQEANNRSDDLARMRDAVVVSQISNSLRSIALAIHEVSIGSNPAEYLKEIKEQSDALWSMAIEWMEKSDGK